MILNRKKKMKTEDTGQKDPVSPSVPGEIGPENRELISKQKRSDALIDQLRYDLKLARDENAEFRSRIQHSRTEHTRLLLENSSLQFQMKELQSENRTLRLQLENTRPSEPISSRPDQSVPDTNKRSYKRKPKGPKKPEEPEKPWNGRDTSWQDHENAMRRSDERRREEEEDQEGMETFLKL
jgi:hypothetical protein